MPNHKPLKFGTLLGGVLKPAAAPHRLTVEELRAKRGWKPVHVLAALLALAHPPANADARVWARPVARADTGRKEGRVNDLSLGGQMRKWAKRVSSNVSYFMDFGVGERTIINVKTLLPCSSCLSAPPPSCRTTWLACARYTRNFPEYVKRKKLRPAGPDGPRRIFLVGLIGLRQMVGK